MKLVKKIKIDPTTYGFQELKITIIPVANSSEYVGTRWTSLLIYFKCNKIISMKLPTFKLIDKNKYEGDVVLLATDVIYSNSLWFKNNGPTDAEYFIRISISDKVLAEEIMKDILNDTIRNILDEYRKAYENNKTSEQRSKELAAESLQRSEALIKYLKNFI